MRALKFSILIRTIATDSTIYFLAVVAVQVHATMSYIFMQVQSLPLSLHSTVIVNSNTPRVSLDNTRLCEYTVDLNGKSSQLTISTSRNEVYMGCTFNLPAPVTN